MDHKARQEKQAHKVKLELQEQLELQAQLVQLELLEQ